MSHKNNEQRFSIPLKKLKDDNIVPKQSKQGDAGADARITGFKKIINENNEKELVDIDSKTYTLQPLERIGCPLGFATAIPRILF